MPLYLTKCLHCGHTGEAVCSMHDREKLRCTQCGREVENDWARTGPPATDSELYGVEGRKSIGMVITDEERDDVLRECPSVEVNRAGQIISKNRRHHREQMKELAAMQQREKDKAAPAIEAQKQAEAREKRERDEAMKLAFREPFRAYKQRRHNAGA